MSNFFFHAQLGYLRQTHCQVSTVCYFPMCYVFKNIFKAALQASYTGFAWTRQRRLGLGALLMQMRVLKSSLCFVGLLIPPPPPAPCVAQHGKASKWAVLADAAEDSRVMVM